MSQEDKLRFTELLSRAASMQGGTAVPARPPSLKPYRSLFSKQLASKLAFSSRMLNWKLQPEQLLVLLARLPGSPEDVRRVEAAEVVQVCHAPFLLLCLLLLLP